MGGMQKGKNSRTYAHKMKIICHIVLQPLERQHSDRNGTNKMKAGATRMIS